MRVIYVIGAGRSGSTVLDTVLGNHPVMEGVGELINLPTSGWINGEYCACGERGDVCPFWSSVRREWSRHVGMEDQRLILEYLDLQRAFERFRSWPRLFKERREPSPQFRTYSERTHALFEAIQVVSGCSIVVDSSKAPTRAFALSLIPSIELYLIHLVRDVRGVTWSLEKRFEKDLEKGVQRDIQPRPAWRTGIFWVLTNLQAEWICRRRVPSRSIFIRYEDFMRQPRATLEKIGKLLEVDVNPVNQMVADQVPMVFGHTIAGNRLRMGESLRLRFDEQWKHKLPTVDKRLVWIIAGWLMYRYGYRY